MFEKLLESILQKYAGKFLDGIDSNNLSIGVFSGDVVIENVSIKQEILNSLELPIQLKFSHIGKLQLKVPLTSIGSSPVQVFLDGLYLLIAPKNPNQWEFKDYKGLQVKKEIIDAYAQNCFQKLIQASKQQIKDEGEKSGYLGKLQLKIIDNIQLTIKSIHIRYEMTENLYSMGLTLDQVDLFTTDDEGKKTYIDRTQEANKDLPMRKQLILSNLGIYWNPKEETMLSSQDSTKKQEIITHMEGMIKRQNQEHTKVPCNYLLTISSMAKLIEYEKGNFDRPEIEIIIDLNRIDLTLQNIQLQQIIILAEFFNKFSLRLKAEKSHKKQLNDLQLQNYQKQFQDLYLKILEEKNQNYSVLSPKENNQLEESIISLEINQLLEIVKNLCVSIEKSKKLKQLSEQKLKESQGFFGGWFGGSKKDQNELVTNDDINELDNYFKENFTSQLDYQNIKRPSDYIWFVIHFSLQGVSIQLSKSLINEQEGIQFCLEQINGQLKLREKNIFSQMSIYKIQLDMTEQISLENGKSQKVINILRSNEFSVQDQNIMNFIYEAYPLETPHIDKSITLRVGSFRTLHNPIFISRLVDFFHVQLQDEQLKEATWEQVEYQIEQAKNGLNTAIVSPSVMKLDVQLISPVIILPFQHDGNFNNECWVFNLGDLKVKTNEQVLMPDLSHDDRQIDKYDISLSNIKFEFYPSVFFNEMVLQKKLNNEESPKWEDNSKPSNYSLIHDFSIQISISLIKQQFQNLQQYKDQANVAIAGQISQIDLKLNSQIYSRLLKISQCFSQVSDDKLQSNISLIDLQVERKVLMKDASKVGQLYIRGATIKTWNKKYCIISKGYLYIFKNIKDDKAETYYWIKDSSIEYANEEFTGFKNSFHVINKYTHIYLASEKPETSEQWIQKLKEQISFNKLNETKLLISDIEHESPLKSGKQSNLQDPLKKLINFQFLIQNINLSLYEDDNETKFLLLETRSMSFNFDSTSVGFNLTLNLQGIQLTDFLYKHRDPLLKDFITSQDLINNNDLIQISLKNKQTTHPDYNNVDIDIEVTFGVLTINFKPDTLIRLLKFIKVPNEVKVDKPSIQSNIQATSKEDKKVQNKQTLISQSQVILFQAKLIFKKIQLVLINRKIPHLPIAEIQIQNIDMIFQKKIDEIFLEGKLGNLQLIDLTNYPNTIYEEDDWEKIKRNEVVGIANKDSSSLLSIKFRSFSEDSPKINVYDNINTFIQINISKIVVIYMMQPVMRLLDYLFIQILGPLTNPDQFEDNIKDQISNVYDPEDYLKVLGEQKILKYIKNPKGMMLDIQIEEPTVIIKPNPDSPEFIEINLGQVTIKNERRLNSSRVIQYFIQFNQIIKGNVIENSISDAFQIHLSNMGIKLIKNNKQTYMCKPFNFYMDIELPIFVNEYNFLYGNQITLDKTMKIRCYLTPLVILMTNDDYNLIMKILFHNIIYDDCCDRFLIHNFGQVQPQKQIQIQQVKDDEPQTSGIYFNLDMENASIFAAEGQDSIPYARITLNKMRLQFIKQINAKVNVFCEYLDGSYFQKQKDTDLYIEKGLLGKFDIYNEYNNNQIQDTLFLIHSIKGQKEIKQQYQFDKFVEDDQKNYLIYKMIIENNGDKNMQIQVNHFILLAEVGPIMKLSKFTMMNESVTPPPPVYHNPVTEQIQKQTGSNMFISILTRDVAICTPAALTQNIFAIDGTFQIQINFYKILSLEEVILKMTQDNISYEESSELNIQSQIIITIQQLEIFIMDNSELLKHSLNQMKKRKMLYPTDIYIKLKSYQSITQDFTQFFSQSSQTIGMSECLLQISTQNVLLIQNTLSSLLEKLAPPKQNEKIQKQEQNSNEIDYQEDTQGDTIQSDSAYRDTIQRDSTYRDTIQIQQQNQIVELQKNAQNLSKSFLNLQCNGIQITVINDIGKIYTPVLEFKVDEFQLQKDNNPLSSKINTSVTFNLQYFNLRSSKWEPVIEIVRIHVDVINNSFGEIQNLLCIDLQPISEVDKEGLFINISSQFVFALVSLINQFKEKYENQQSIKLNDHNISEMKSEFEQIVSPYTIMNETGYPVIICPSDQKTNDQKIIIQSNEQINYQVQLTLDNLNNKINSGKQDNISFNLVCKNYKFQDIQNIDQERIRFKKIQLVSYDFKPKQNQYLTTQVKLDLKTNRKILYISSSLVFFNLTLKNIGFTFKFQSQSFEKIIIQTSKTVPVPFECFDGVLDLSVEGEENQHLYSLQLKDIQSKSLIEIKVGEYYLILRISTDPVNVYKKIVNVEAPYRFKNCLPKSIFIQILNSDKMTDITKQLKQYEVYEHYNQSQNQKSYIKILLPGLFWSQDQCLYNQDCNISSLRCSDCKGSSVSIPVFQNLTGNTIGCREYFIYCKSYVINQTEYELLYYMKDIKNSSNYLEVGGQQITEIDDNISSPLIIFGEEFKNSLKIANKQLPLQLSDSVPVTGVGTNQVDVQILKDGKNFWMTLEVSVYLKEIIQNQGIIVQIINIYPKHILVNQSSCSIIIKQSNVQFLQNFQEIIVKKDERQLLLWADQKQEKKIYINYFQTDPKFQGLEEDQLLPNLHSQWEWSKALDLSNVGVYNLMIRGKNDKKIFKYLRINTKNVDGIIYMVFEDVAENEIPYKIENKISLGFASIELPQINRTLDFNEFSYFSWENPNDSQKQLTFIIHPNDKRFSSQTLNISPDKINFKQKIEFKDNKDQKQYLKVSIIIQGFTKIIRFQTSSNQENFKQIKERSKTFQQDTIIRQISVHLEQIGISIIYNHYNRPQNYKESLYLKMEHLELAIQEKKLSKVTQVRLKYLNIDNNGDYFTAYPVLLTTHKNQIYKNKESENYFLNVVVSQNLIASSITLIDNLVFEMDPLSIKLESPLVMELVKIMSEFFEILNTQNYEAIELEQLNTQIDDLQNKKFKYFIQQLPDSDLPTYIDEIIVSPIHIYLTFNSKKTIQESSQQQFQLFDTLISTIGVTMLNVDDSPIQLTGIKLSNCFDTLSGIKQKIISHYKDQALRQVLKILGSLNILGNPVYLFSNISNGVTDLFEKPIEGFAKGPLEGGMGIMKGAGSLLSNTLSGAFNSASKMTSALGSGFAMLCFDDKYLEQRQKMINHKPKHLGEGVVQGLEHLGTGVFEGISGVFLKPFEGAQKDGIAGFFKGVGQGLTGLAVKPLTGLIDVVSKTAGGLQKQMTYFDDNENERRERPIRVFYGPDRYIKSFNQVDGEMVCVLQLLKKGIYSKSIFITSIPIKENDGVDVIVLLLDSIILLENKKSKHKWIIKNSQIKKVELYQKQIKIQFNETVQYFKSNEGQINISNPAQREYCYYQIQYLLDLIKEESEYIIQENDELKIKN